MVKSMTGFGRCEVSEGDRKMTVEMKSVNHRYLDVTIKMPKKLNYFESAIRSLLKSYIQRGKVDVFITYEDLSESNVSLRYNQALAAEYLKYLNQMAEEFGLEQDVNAGALSRYPEVLVMEEVQDDVEELWRILAPLQPTPALLGCGLVLRRPLFPACAGHTSKVRAAPDALAGIRCSAPLLLSGPFPLCWGTGRFSFLLKQSRDPAVLVHVDLFRRRDLGQAGHGSPRDHSPAGAPSFVSSGGQSPPCGNSSLRSEFTAHARRGATAPT